MDSATADSTIDATVGNAISASFDDTMADRPSHDLTDYPISGSVDVDVADEVPIASANIPTQQTNESNTVLAEESAGHIHKNPIEIRSNAPVCHGGTSTILNCNTTSPSWDMKVTRTYIDYNDDESNKGSKRLKSSNGSRITIYQPVRKLETAERSSKFGQVCMEVYTIVQKRLSLVPLKLLQSLIIT